MLQLLQREAPIEELLARGLVVPASNRLILQQNPLGMTLSYLKTHVKGIKRASKSLVTTLLHVNQDLLELVEVDTAVVQLQPEP